MPRFKCVNEDCSLYEKEILVEKVRFKWDESSKKLKPSPLILCLNTQQKREVIKKRSMDHFRKHDKGDLANYKKKIIEDNKRMVRGEL